MVNTDNEFNVFILKIFNNVLDFIWALSTTVKID
jgi:hypothetical protein